MHGAISDAVAKHNAATKADLEALAQKTKAVISLSRTPSAPPRGSRRRRAIGATSDLGRSDTRQQAEDETRFVLGIGQSAVIADVSEDWTTPIDTRMRSLGGTVYRRHKSDVRDDAWWGASYLYPYGYYLYPYEPLAKRLTNSVQ